MHATQYYGNQHLRKDNPEESDDDIEDQPKSPRFRTKELDKLAKEWSALVKNEKIILELLRKLKMGEPTESSEEEIQSTLDKIFRDKQRCSRIAQSHLKQLQLITGSLAGYSTLTSQYLFYVSQQNQNNTPSLQLVRYGPSIWSDVSVDPSDMSKLEKSYEEKKGQEIYVPRYTADSSSLSSWVESVGGWMSTVAKYAKTTIDYVSSSASAAIPSWSRANLTEVTKFASVSGSLAIVGQPVCHATLTGSQHVFFVVKICC